MCAQGYRASRLHGEHIEQHKGSRMARTVPQEALTDELELERHIRESDQTATTIHVHKAVNGAGNRGPRVLTVAVDELATVRERLLATYGPGTYVLQSKREGGQTGRSATVELIAPLGWSPPTRPAPSSAAPWSSSSAPPSQMGTMLEQMQMMRMMTEMMRPPKDPLTQLTETIAMRAAMQSQGMDPKEMLELGMRLAGGSAPKSDVEIAVDAASSALGALLAAKSSPPQMRALAAPASSSDAPVSVVVRLLPMACALVEHGGTVDEALAYLQGVIGCTVTDYRNRNARALVDELGARPDLLERVNACGLGAAMMA